MTQSEYVSEVLKELEAENLTVIRKVTKQRFLAVDKDGNQYAIRVKFCIKPRKLVITDVGHMNPSFSEDMRRILVTNGTDATSLVQNLFKVNHVHAILNWVPGKKIIE